MSLASLEADNLRIVEHITLEPGPHLNVIAGPNGSGKTTLLEASICSHWGARSVAAARPSYCVRALTH